MITEFPLLVFTVLTGLAAGAYVAAAAFPPKEQAKNAVLFPVICLVLAAVGSVASVLHVGRPALVFGIFANPTSSLTLEAIFAGLFCIGIIVDLVMAAMKKSNRAVSIVVAVLGVALLLVQAHAYATSYGVAAWCSPAIWPFVLLSAVAAGFPLAGCFGAAQGGKTPSLAACVLLVLGGLCAVIEAVIFNGAAADGVMVIALGAVIMFVAAACAFMAKDEKATMVYATAVLAIVALFVMRYGFYMASII